MILFFNFLKNSLHIFALLCVVFLPIPLAILPSHTAAGDWVFKIFLILLIKTFNTVPQENLTLSSDSLLLYCMIAVLFILSFLISFLLLLSKFWQKNKEKFFAFIRAICAYFVALQLLKYGFAKIFKTQFYLPEPNILFTPFGELSPDILFWSVMGTSYSYNVFSGIAEVSAGLLIVWKKTRVAGLLLSVILLSNIVAINLGFDISVKLFTMLLVFLTLLCLSPQFHSLYNFFISQKTISLRSETSIFPKVPGFYFVIINAIIGFLLLIEALYPFFQENNFNDDLAARPPMHGAYQVIHMSDTKTKNSNTNAPSIKRIFIHRQGYLILQNQNDQMSDFKLKINHQKNQLIVTDYSNAKFICPYSYNKKASTLTINFTNATMNFHIVSQKLNWKSLQAVQPAFHWTIEEVK